MTLFRCPISTCNQNAFSTERRFVFFHMKNHYLDEIYESAKENGISDPENVPKMFLVNWLINQAKVPPRGFRY